MWGNWGLRGDSTKKGRVTALRDLNSFGIENENGERIVQENIWQIFNFAVLMKFTNWLLQKGRLIYPRESLGRDTNKLLRSFEVNFEIAFTYHA